MTKSSKLIATLGVVAGLGVAALPLGSVFAAEASVEGQVDVIVEVKPAIAMTITGNNDAVTDYSNLELYSDVDGNTSGTVKRSTAFTSTPTATNAETGTGSGIFKTTTTALSSSKIDILPNSFVNGATGEGSNEFNSKVTVWTNDASGYTLALSGFGALSTGGSSAETIPGDGIVKAGHSGWGYKTTAVTGEAADDTTSNYDHADANISTLGTATSATGDLTTVFYGVSTSGSQASGTYTRTITYTATTN